MQDIRERIKNDLVLSPGRMTHTIAVAQTALSLSSAHFPHLSPVDVEIAALLHDLTKEYTLSQHEEVCRRYGDMLSRLEYSSPQLIHSHTAALIAKNVYCASDDVTHAVRVHTTACRDMSPLDMVIYLADYIEPNRKGAFCTAVREIYVENGCNCNIKALYMAISASFDKTLSHLAETGAEISPQTVAARDWIQGLIASL